MSETPETSARNEPRLMTGEQFTAVTNATRMSMPALAHALQVTRPTILRWRTSGIPAGSIGRRALHLLHAMVIRRESSEPLIGPWLVTAMRDAGMSIADLAHYCGVSVHTVHQWRAGVVPPETHDRVPTTLGPSPARGLVPEGEPITGDAFASMLANAGMTYPDAANVLNVSRNTIHRWAIGGVPRLQEINVRALIAA